MILELKYDSLTKKISFDSYVGDEKCDMLVSNIHYGLSTEMLIIYSKPYKEGEEWKTKNLLLKELEKDMQRMYNLAFTALSQVKQKLY